jgi:carboxylesterase type B
VRALGDFLMTCPTRDSMRWLLAASNASSPRNVYEYLYVHNNSVMGDMMPFLGVCHASELLSVWDIDIMLLGPGEVELAETMTKYWTNFASTGKPDGGPSTGLPPWQPYGSASIDNLAILDTGCAGGGVNVTNAGGVRKAECDFWWDKQVEARAGWLEAQAARSMAGGVLNTPRW